MIKSYLEAVNDALDTAMGRDENVVIMGEDVGVYGGGMGVTAGLIEKYGPSRVMDTPVSESAFTGAAAGCAMLGMKPVVEIIFADFTSLIIDPLINHAAKMHFMSAGTINVPMVVRTPLGSGTGAAAQHSQSVENMFLNVPGIFVAAPSNAYDAKGLMLSAIECSDPVMYFEHKKCYPLTDEVPEGYYTVPLGKAKIAREGKDITIVSYSHMVNTVLQAAEALEKEGISAEVIDLRSLRPLDTDTILASVEKTGRALVVTEAPAFGGFSGEIASVIAENASEALVSPLKRLGGTDMPIAYNEGVESAQVPDVPAIINKVKEIMK